MGGLFAWISTATFVFQDIFGLSALMFGLAFAVASGGYLVGTAYNLVRLSCLEPVQARKAAA